MFAQIMSDCTKPENSTGSLRAELPKPVGDGGAKKATEEASGPEEQSRV